MVWWSAQASSRRYASSSTEGVRLRDHVRKPSVAALNPQIVQRNFAIFFSSTPLFCESSSHSVSDAERGKDVSSGEEIFGRLQAGTTIDAWIRDGWDGCWG